MGMVAQPEMGMEQLLALVHQLRLQDTVMTQLVVVVLVVVLQSNHQLEKIQTRATDIVTR